MSRSKALGIAGGVFGVLAAGFGLLASANYSAAAHYSGPMSWGGRQDAADLAAIPSMLAWICLAAAVLCVVLAIATKPSTD